MDLAMWGQALAVILDPLHMLLLIGAVLLGVVVGAAPGLTSTMAIGLLLPLTFTLGMAESFILLLGIYCGAIYGGSITAILMNVPGTPTSAVTAIDGYPMTRRGEGGKAIGIATMSSTLGGLISCVFLIFLSLRLAQVAAVFGPTEYFSLAFLGMAVVFSLTSKSVLKGLIAASLGLLLSTVGLDLVAPYPRFIFGVPLLMIGIPTVPAIIGLFCVSEAFRMADASGSIRGHVQKEVSGLWLAVRYIGRLWMTIIKSSLIGTVIGILPGTGAVMASFMAYGEARRVSRTPEKFGKGSEEGICASEAANNAVTGGALIPALTLGIPGDTNTLMLLAAMLIHGLIPGPMLFREQTKLVYIIFSTMIFANLLILPLGLGLSKYVAKVATIDRKYVMPVVSVLAITGAAIGYGHVYYFWISIIFGFLGYILEKGGYPVLAVAMALILGPLMERNLRTMMMIPGAGFHLLITRPISAVLILAAVATIVFGLRRQMVVNKRDQEARA